MEDSIEARRRTERARYARIHADDPLYGASNHGSDARVLLLGELNAKSIIDVGCGDNAFALWFRQQGIHAIGVDVADQRADFVSPAHELPFQDREFEFVTCFDVLEHLWPDEIDDVLDEFRRVSSRGLVVSISFLPSSRETPGGNLHRTVRPESWWLSLLMKRLRQVEKHKTFLYGIWV